MGLGIYYFSGTGNCLKAARDLAKELPGAQLINIAEVINKNLDVPQERIGIICPVYAFSIPLIVIDFIKRLAPKRHKYIFIIVTYGGIAGNPIVQAQRQLDSQGLKLDAAFYIRMPGNYTPFGGAIAQDKQKMMFEGEEKNIKDIAYIVRESLEHAIPKAHFLFRGLFDGIAKMASRRFLFEDRLFWVDDKCNSCGICQKVCPVENIQMDNGKPKWLHKCQQCFACLQWCPTTAIQCGKFTAGRKRYINPYVKLEDFIRND